MAVGKYQIDTIYQERRWKMEFRWKTNDQRFRVYEASLFREFAKSDYHKIHADDYLIIFNITDSRNRLFKKARVGPTSMFIQKKYMIDRYNPYLMTELDFNDEYAANEFRGFFNYMITGRID
jgi:hypothetical protein